MAGYGHWHLNLDSMSGLMMGMGTMFGMSCTTIFHANTQGLKPGETLMLIALLTDNGHAQHNLAVDSQVTVVIELPANVNVHGTAIASGNHLSIPSLHIDRDMAPGLTVTMHVLKGSNPLVFFCKYHRGAGMLGALLPHGS